MSENSLENLFEKARAEEPFGAPRNYGFKARLRESLRSTSEPRAFDVFTVLCWRFGLFCFPLTVIAVTVLSMSSSHPVPSEVSGLIAICSDYLSF